MNKVIVPIKGMHCRSCEILIADKLKELPEVKSVSVNFKKNEAYIYSQYKLNLFKVRRAIADAGYEIGAADSKDWINKNPGEYLDLGISALILLALYFLAKSLGIFNISAAFNNSSSLIVVLIVGLTAGFSSCMALVGGLVIGISARHTEAYPEATAKEKFRPHIFFNLGRIIFFAILGGIIGLIGKAFQFSPTTLGIITIGVGLVMLILGLQLTEIFPRLSNNRLTLPPRLSKILGIKQHHNKEYSHLNSMFVGALTFFLPCGFTQAMQIYAVSSGNFWSGAAIMGLFALGTTPGLLSVGGLTSILKGEFMRKAFKLVGLIVIALAVLNLSNGLNLTGWKSVFTSSSSSSQASAGSSSTKIVDGVQVIRMTQLAGAYKPNKFVVKKDIPVRWIIDSQSDSCASAITISKLGIRKNLAKGENIIEFTPKNTGELRFSCIMGMYNGKFIVE